MATAIMRAIQFNASMAECLNHPGGKSAQHQHFERSALQTKTRENDPFWHVLGA